MPRLMTIADDTPILPDVIARTVVEDVERWLDAPLPERARYIQQCLTRAERLYLHNVSFRRKVRASGDRGRDYLYCFMRHWLAGLLLDTAPDIARRMRHAGVWSAFANGQSLPEAH